ncbi:MAG: FAD/NAD(P)-binding protein [Verrucomicrobiales bacterium]
MIPTPWRVAYRRDETEDVFTLGLEPVENDTPRPPFAPGQFNMLYAFGAGESAISISGDPGSEGGCLVHTVRRAGVVTSALSRLRPGEQIGVRGPFGKPWPLDEMRGRDLVFVAGGIGLAPLRPAIYHALAHRQDYGRLVILAGARSPEEVLFGEEFDQWKTEDGVESRLTVDHAGESWTRDVGVVTKLITKADFDPANAAALICGPEIMMRYTAMELRSRGLTNEQIFITMERNMKCAVAFCGHCQLGPEFLCKDGPVYRFDRIAFWFAQREV